MNNGERFSLVKWLQSKLESQKQPESNPSLVIPRENFQGIKKNVEDETLEEKLGPIIDTVIETLQEKLPAIQKFSLTQERLNLAKDRIIHIQRGSLENFVLAYLKSFHFKFPEHLNSESIGSGVYIGAGDFIALSVDPDEQEENQPKDEEHPFLTVAEEILHFLLPFNPEQLKKISDSLANKLNEGATLYYLEKAYPDFHFFEKMKNPQERSHSGNMRYFFSLIWKEWVAEHGEERMAACYFGRRKFPKKVLKAIEGGLNSEMVSATLKTLN